MKYQYRIIALMKQGIFSFILLTMLLSCNRKWTEKDKSEFLSGCLSAAMRDSLTGEKYSRDYCKCLLEKVVEQYPNANDINYIKYDTTIRVISRSCLENIKRDTLSH